jgi:8-oxo-dGTP pyrophosphatase MutT (NUDIX family)
MIELIQYLRSLDMADLPGLSAHKTMAPPSRTLIRFDEADYPHARKASVLILLYPKRGIPHLVLTQRPDYDGVHSGQVSFPGGQLEASDPGPWEAAIRETFEEIGVERQLIEPAGQLSHIYIPPSNFFVYPFLGYMEQEPIFIPDDKEVAHIIEMPLFDLLDERIRGEWTMMRQQAAYTVPCYYIQGRAVWGATAIILSELEVILRKFV